MASTPRDDEFVDEPHRLREYLATLRLRKWSVILVTSLVVASTLVFSFLQTPLYEAQAKLLVRPITVSSQLAAPAPPNLETERGLVSSVPVAQMVAERLGIEEEPSDLLESLEVEVIPASEFLIVKYRHPDPLEAQRRSQGFAGSYLEFRRQQAVQDQLAASQTVERQLRDLTRRLTELEAEIEETNSPSDLSALELQRNTLIGRIAVLEQQLSDLTVPESLRVGQVVEPAEVPSSPATPNYLVNVPIALLVGLTLGLGLAFLRERLDDRLRGREDLEGRVGAPALAVIPKVPGWKRGQEARLVTAEEPRSTASEAYRTLRTSLLFTASQNGVRTVQVTSPHVREGKTTTVANLAVALGQAGKRVVVVDTDLRNPRLHRFFKAENGTGLTNLLAGEVATQDAIVSLDVPNVRLLSSGPVPGNPAELLSSDAMGRLLDDLREETDFVILDSAPVLVAADASILASHADALLMVADADRATRGSVAHARAQLDQVNARVVGAVLNNFDLAKAREYPYQYYYVYRYQPTEGGQQTWRAAREGPEAPGEDSKG